MPMPKVLDPTLTECPPKPDLRDRPLLSPEQATELTAVFKVLTSDTRLRLLHALVRTNGMCVSALAETVGMKPQAVSNQLQRLVDQGILASHRHGTYIHYRIVDPCAVDLLDQGLCLLEDTKAQAP